MAASKSSPALLGIGDNVVDFYRDRGEFFPGGNALNVPVLAKRYGLAKTGYIGLIGNDAEGAHVRSSLDQEGVWTGRLRQAFGPNGKAVVSLDDQGDRVFLGSNKGGIQRALALRMDVEDIEAIESFGNIHTSVFSYLEPELPKIRAHAQTLTFDFSTHRDPTYIASVAPHITGAFLSGSGLSDGEVDGLIQYVAGFGVTTVGVTRGSDGAFWLADGRRYRQGIKPANVVDTLGAGDSFLAGYLTGVLTGRSIEAALDFAAECASATCGYFGAFGYPHPASD
ncbi:PfkB family carbohydrate kinase [Pleomorphomonas oryzae]|uniref:PfkB family carbohydrate kinase n=1 Tax=Pleomorphomonas oryzae TaxID=261934 RepID=UPI0004139DAB|nr:PfkB family carbohydrate kinase [Pleomorphomonas oryzae]